MPNSYSEKLSPARSEAGIAEAKPRYTDLQAITEASRCLYCHDAPLYPGLPHQHQHPGVYSPHCHRQYQGRSPHHSRRQYLGSELCFGLPGGSALRGQLRLQPHGGQTD